MGADYNGAMSGDAFTVRAVEWNEAREQLHAVRRAVFVEEQNVPEDLEWDEADERASHVLATAPDGMPIGTGRIKRDGRIGRMAVTMAWRRRGVGSAMLEMLLVMARAQGLQVVHLHAQTHAMPFYSRHGFVARGEEFEEAGIPHRLMELAFTPRPRAT
jgi:predicted GNAT family N-acyltransferase